jgi:hypothetical protein
VDVKPVSYLRAAQIVSERSLMPLVFPRHRKSENAAPDKRPGEAFSTERRSRVDRRRFSRRIRHKSASPYDTRAMEERRTGNRRSSDITTRIEEKI